MKISDIQNGTELYFPSTVEGKIKKYIVEDFRKDSDNEGLFSCKLSSGSGRFFAELWEKPEDSRKSPDHVAFLVPLYQEFGYGGMLIFYFTENGATMALRNIRK